MGDKSEHSKSPTKSPSALSAMNELLTSLQDQVQRGDNSDTGLECSICTELFMMAVTLSCSHTFCKWCIMQWQKEHRHCPMCRTPIKQQTRTVVIDKLVNKVLKKADEKVHKRREAVRAEREELMLEKLAKLDAVMSAMMHEIVADQDSLVTHDDAFSRWTSEWLPGIFDVTWDV